MDKKSCRILCILFIAVVVLYILSSSYEEGFNDRREETQQCGVDLPSCSGEHVRCINGYCRSDVAPTLPPLSDLPMTPPTAY